MISLLVICLSSALLVNSIPIQQAIQSRDNYDAILNLLPLYGNTKLEKVINKKSLDSVKVNLIIRMFILIIWNYLFLIKLPKGYFDKNPKNYETLRTALATEGVFMPPLNELKLEVITTEDYSILKGLIGSYTLRDALNAQTVNKIIVIF